MNCGRVSNLLSAYIDRELTGAEIAQLRSHLGDCDDCRAEYEALARTKMMLGNLCGPEPSQAFLAAALHRIETSGARMPGASGRAPDGLDRWLAGLMRRLAATLDAGGTRSRGWSFASPALGLLRTRARPRLAIGLTTAALAAALIFTSVVLRKPRHSDALIATSPVAMIQGQDPLSLQPMSEWAADDFADRSAPQSRLPGSAVPLQWITVSLQREGSRSFR